MHVWFVVFFEVMFQVMGTNRSMALTLSVEVMSMLPGWALALNSDVCHIATRHHRTGESTIIVSFPHLPPFFDT